MGREVRRVPANWQHPSAGFYRDGRQKYRALFDGVDYARRLGDWEEGAAKWKQGLRRDYSAVTGADQWKALDGSEEAKTYGEWDGERPDAADYMPQWADAERTHWQMYETTSEGTPISPVMESSEMLVDWLVKNRASAFADMTMSRESWMRVIGGDCFTGAISVNGGPLVPAPAILADPV